MSMISFRVTDEEKDELNEASKMYGGSISYMIKRILFERLHDDYDMKIAMDFEKKLEKGEIKDDSTILVRERPPTPLSWPGEFHGLYSPWGHKESDTTKRLSLLKGQKDNNSHFLNL